MKLRSERFGALALILAVVPAVLLWRTAGEAWQVPVIDPDLWWQLWAGEQMLDGTFPRHNTFSWTAPETRWVTHEPIVALTYAWAGIGAIGWIRGLVVTSAYAMVLHLATRPASAWATAFAVAWATPLVVLGTTERALSWGNLFLAAVGGLALQGTRKALLAAAALVGVWANVHGSFVIGVLWLLLTNWRFGLLGAALSLVNPNGWAVWELVTGYGLGTGAQGVVHQFVSEWLPLDLTTRAGAVKAGCLVISGALVFRARPGWGRELELWRPRILWLVTTWLAIRHARYSDVAGIALLPFVARELEARLPARVGPSPVLPFLVLMGLTAVLSPRPSIPDERYPRQIVQYIPADSRIWNDFHLGGFLGYHGRAVFWDSRNDCYPEAVFKDGVAVMRMTHGWLDVLDRWRVDTVVTAQPVLRDALAHEGFQLRGQSGGVSVLVRSRDVDRD